MCTLHPSEAAAATVVLTKTTEGSVLSMQSVRLLQPAKHRAWLFAADTKSRRVENTRGNWKKNKRMEEGETGGKKTTDDSDEVRKRKET